MALSRQASKPAAGPCITTQLACRLVCCCMPGRQHFCSPASALVHQSVPLFVHHHSLYISLLAWHGMRVVQYMPHVQAHAGSAATCSAQCCSVHCMAWHGGDFVLGPRPQCSCMCMVLKVEGLGTDVCPEIACSPLPAFSVRWGGCLAEAINATQLVVHSPLCQFGTSRGGVLCCGVWHCRPMRISLVRFVYCGCGCGCGCSG